MATPHNLNSLFDQLGDGLLIRSSDEDMKLFEDDFKDNVDDIVQKVNKLLSCDPVTTVKLFENHSDASHAEMDRNMIRVAQTDLVITSVTHELMKDLDINAILQKQAEDHGRKNHYNYNHNNHNNQMKMMNYQMYQRMNMIMVNVVYVMMKVRHGIHQHYIVQNVVRNAICFVI